MKKNKKHQREKYENSTVSVPFRPKKISCRYYCDDKILTLHQNRMTLGTVVAGCFITLWLIGWTVGCVMLVRMVFAGQWFMIIFGIPFWGAWFLVFGLLMNMLFGRGRIQLGEEGLDYQYRILVKVIHHKVPLDEIRCFRVRGSQTEDHTGNNPVEAVTYGKPICFSNVLFEEAEWMNYELNRMLVQLKGTESQEKLDAGDETHEENESKADGFDATPLLIPKRSKPEDVEKPSDCRWQQVGEFDSVTFFSRGRFSWVGCGAVIFANFFCNGIVAVCVLSLWGFVPRDAPPTGIEWWGMFFFLIPFEVIGLFIFIVWLALLFAPFQLKKWTISRAAAKYKYTWFGIGPTRNYDLENCEAMQIDSDDRKTFWKVQNLHNSNENQEMWKIIFRDSQGSEICSISNLTLGEAHWMVDQILKYQ